MEMTMRPMTEMEQMYCYSQSQQLMATTGCIGHLRGDLDSTGEQFYSSWDDHQAQHKTQEFKDEFDAVIHALRTDRNLGALCFDPTYTCYHRNYRIHEWRRYQWLN